MSFRGEQIVSRAIRTPEVLGCARCLRDDVVDKMRRVWAPGDGIALVDRLMHRARPMEADADGWEQVQNAARRFRAPLTAIFARIEDGTLRAGQHPSIEGYGGIFIATAEVERLFRHPQHVGLAPSAFGVGVKTKGAIQSLIDQGYMSVTASASKGIATLNMRGSAFGPAHLLRRTKVAVMSDSGLIDFAEAFWPADQHERGFQPEPGCSEPTFVGSAADIAFFASSFFNFAASALRKGGDSKATACFVRAPHDDGSMSSHVVPLCQPSVHVEAHHGYRVHLSHRAKSAIDSEIKSNAPTGSAKDETGGILLGEIDDALGIISIDAATGPPPDSKKSPELFECGIEGTHALCAFHAKESGNSTKFVGVWHTHPVSMPRPSMVDLRAMAQILHLQEKTPRHVVMLIVGHAATRPSWRFHLFRRNEFQVVTLAVEESVDE